MSVKDEVRREPETGSPFELSILQSPSVSSFSSSVSTKIGYPLSEHRVERAIKPMELAPQCWRRYDIDDLLRRGDEISIGQLCRFGLYDDDFADLRGLEKFCSQAEDHLPYSKYWDWSLHKFHKDGSASIASELSEKSRRKFERIPFEEFVRKAFGLSSPAIEHFLWQCQLLSAMLYYKFIGNLEHKGLLLQLKERLEKGKADPFVCAATATAWEKVSNTENKLLDSKLNEALDIIIKPLHQTLKKNGSVQSIMQQLEVLRVRFCSHYYAPEANWEVSINNCTEFLDRLKCIGVSALAEALSGEDHAFYKLLSIQSSQEDPRGLRDINDRWNRLCCSVKECLDAGVVSASEMNQLAGEFYHHHNFYSFTAVISGIEAHGSLTHTPQEHAHVLDLARDYGLAAQLIYMCKLYPVDASASSDDKMEYRSTTTANTSECIGVMSGFRILAGQIWLESCLSCCFGR